MAEQGLFCETCQAQRLHRRGEPNHLLWAILTLFSCGLFAFGWLMDSGKKRPWLCTFCGTASNATVPPPFTQIETPEQAAARWQANRRFVLACVALLVTVVGVLIIMNVLLR